MYTCQTTVTAQHHNNLRHQTANIPILLACKKKKNFYWCFLTFLDNWARYQIWPVRMSGQRISGLWAQNDRSLNFCRIYCLPPPPHLVKEHFHLVILILCLSDKTFADDLKHYKNLIIPSINSVFSPANFLKCPGHHWLIQSITCYLDYLYCCVWPLWYPPAGSWASWLVSSTGASPPSGSQP